MEFNKINNKGQARLFSNKYLEFFTKTHPLIIWGMYTPVILVMLTYSYSYLHFSLLHTLATFAAGIIFWTLFEYFIHRFAFHFITESKKALKIVYIIHGNHHEYPRDRQRLFMPPLPSIIIASVVFGLMYVIGLALGIPTTTFAFFPGFILGYLLYGTMHYAIHAWNPPYKWMKSLWRNHHLHHYKNDHLGFGVSTTLWDRLFGTMFKAEGQKTNNTKIRKMRL